MRGRPYEKNIQIQLVVFNGLDWGLCTSLFFLKELNPLLCDIAINDFWLTSVDDGSLVLLKTSNGRQYSVRATDWKYVTEVDRLRTVTDSELNNLTAGPDERDVADSKETVMRAWRTCAASPTNVRRSTSTIRRT